MLAGTSHPVGSSLPTDSSCSRAAWRAGARESECRAEQDRTRSARCYARVMNVTSGEARMSSSFVSPFENACTPFAAVSHAEFDAAIARALRQAMLD